MCKLQRTGRRLDPVNAVFVCLGQTKVLTEEMTCMNTITCVCPSAEVQSVHEVIERLILLIVVQDKGCMHKKYCPLGTPFPLRLPNVIQAFSLHLRIM